MALRTWFGKKTVSRREWYWSHQLKKTNEADDAIMGYASKRAFQRE